MAPIYTKSFFVGSAPANTLTTLHTVPLGFVAVLRDVELVWSGTGDYLELYAAGWIVAVLAGTAVGPFSYARWHGRIAIGAGNTFQVNPVGTSASNVAATGYELTA